MIQPSFPWPSVPQQSLMPQATQVSTSTMEASVGKPQAQHITNSTKFDKEKQSESESDEESDVVNLLNDVEAEQFRDFDPEVKDPQKWQPPPSVVKHLDKHFNKSLSETDRQAILNDYPIPDCAAVTAPSLDAEVMEQLKSKGKDP